MLLVERMKIIQLFPVEWFTKLTSLFLFDDIYICLRETYHGVPPPIGTPQDNHEKATCVKKIFSYTVAYRLEMSSILEMTDQLTPINLPVSSVPCFHPQILKLVGEIFKSNENTYSNFGIIYAGC